MDRETRERGSPVQRNSTAGTYLLACLCSGPVTAELRWCACVRVRGGLAATAASLYRMLRRVGETRPVLELFDLRVQMLSDSRSGVHFPFG